MANLTRASMYLSFLLRHHPEDAGLTMDRHGWVSIAQLLENLAAAGRYPLTRQELEQIVAQDEKGRYRIDPVTDRIKACQGHSLAWIEPELNRRQVPHRLYHGTTEEAYRLILQSGAIRRMQRHHVHMTESENLAFKSARRWRKAAAVLVIDGAALERTGLLDGVSDNDVWCAQEVPIACIVDVLREPSANQ